MKSRIPFGLIGVALIAASALAMTLSQPTVAHAQVAAKVESQTRPIRRPAGSAYAQLSRPVAPPV